MKRSVKLSKCILTRQRFGRSGTFEYYRRYPNKRHTCMKTTKQIIWCSPNHFVGSSKYLLWRSPDKYDRRHLKFCSISTQNDFKGSGAIYHSYGFKHWIATPTKCDSILIFTSFYNKVYRGIAYFNTKMSYLSDFECTQSKTLRTASTGRITNWTKPPCEPVQIIRTKDRYF